MIKRQIRKILGPKTINFFKSILKRIKVSQLNRKRRKFYLQFLNKGDVFFDVGSNYGNRIEPIINSGITIVAIEPQKDCIDYLVETYRDKIKIEPVGLGSKKEIRTLYVSNVNTISTFSKSWIESTTNSGRFSEYNWNTKVEVELDTLDNLILKHGVPSFIKIDVEGYEFEVLKGLSYPIRTLSFEYTVPEKKDLILNCIDRVLEISNNCEVLFNYSIGESMKLKFKEWLEPNAMRNEIESTRFVNSGFGDIYVKTKIY